MRQIMYKKATVRDSIYQALKEHGPMSTADISRITGKNQNAVAMSINEARHRYGTEHFYIAERGRTKIYGAGPGDDAPMVKKKSQLPEVKIGGIAHPFGWLMDL